jgi:hypothetical protein
MSAELEQSYFIYWKGRQSGPFSEPELREMLEREEISLAHQVFHQGRQTSLSEFLQQKREASATQLDAVDPILASHLQSAIKMHTTGAQILKEVIFESRKIHPEIVENEIVKSFLFLLKAMPRSSSATEHAASAGIPGLDAAAPAPEPFAKQLSACLKWERDFAAHAIQAKEVSAMLSKKYSVKFSPNPESYDP